MGVLNIRNLPDHVHSRLRVRAAKAGRSMEAEARAILIDACRERGTAASSSSLQDLVDRLYGKEKPEGVVDRLIEDRRREAARE